MLIKLPKDKFEGYFGLTRDELIIFSIKSKNQGQGDFSDLLKMFMQIRSRIEVPTPSNQMREILLKKGFRFEDKWFGDGFDCYGKILVWEEKK